jgi:hypothetical protein
MTRELTHHENAFHDASLFNLEVTDRRGTRNLRCYAHDGRGYDGKPFINQNSSCLKSHYTDEDRATTERLRTEEPVRHGDVVTLSGKTYRVHVNGDYSDAAKLIEVGA